MGHGQSHMGRQMILASEESPLTYMNGVRIGTPVLSILSRRPATQSAHLPAIVEHREGVRGDMRVRLVVCRHAAN